MAASNTNYKYVDVSGMPAPGEIDDKLWEELTAPLQTAAAKLGYNQELWDSDREPCQCDRNWSELTLEQQKAAKLLGYTSRTWDAEECSRVDTSVDTSVDTISETGDANDGAIDDDTAATEHRINALKSEILHRQKKLRRLLGKKEGTAYARMIQSHEECVNSFLEQRLKDPQKGPSKQGQFPSLKLSPLQVIQNAFLNEYYHSLPGFVSITLHCLLYSTLTDLTKKLIVECSHVTTYFSGWHIIDNNFDDSFEEHAFFFAVALFAFALLRVTGAIFDWDQDRAFQRKRHFHFRNRWHLRCWDMRVMNWFSGGEIQEMFDKSTGTSKPEDASERKWGPRLRSLLNIFSFFILCGCVDFLVEEFGPKMILNQKEAVLEGLPSRQLQQRRNESSHNERGETHCFINRTNNASDSAEECRVDSEVDFISDIYNWIKNADRCGQALDGDRDDDDDNEEEGEDDSEDDGCEHCPQKPDNGSGIFSMSKERAPKRFKPWKQSDEEWKRLLNKRDDEYLRDSISEESYYALVGDPDAHFIPPLRELVYYAATAGISLGCLYWFEIPFQLM